MAKNNTNTNNTNTTAAEAPTDKREHVELPELTVTKSKFEIPDTIKRTRVNPLAAALAAANADRTGTYSIKGLTEQRQADKAIRLLVQAGREATPPCSIRTMYKADENTLYFKAVDLVKRNRKPKEGETSGQ